MNITHYFSWDLRPAIIVDMGQFSNAYYIEDGQDDWLEADTQAVLDMFAEGSQMTEEEFTKEFGVLGTDLPKLP